VSDKRKVQEEDTQLDTTPLPTHPPPKKMKMSPENRWTRVGGRGNWYTKEIRSEVRR